MSDNGSERYKLVYEEALGSIERQEATLNEMRARVGTLLATTVIATAFFGSLAAHKLPLGNWQWAAVSLIVVTSFLQVVLIIPLPGWQFRRDPSVLISDYIEADPPRSLEDMYRNLALYIDEAISGNDGRLSWMWWVLTASAVILVAEVAVWLVAIAKP